MSKGCQVKVYYKDLANKNVVGKADLFSFQSYDKLKDLIMEKSKAQAFKNVRLNEKHKFILEISDYEMAGLKAIWDTDTYKYFFDTIQQNPPEKIKLIIKKVDEFPKFERPKYLTILAEALIFGWESTKKEIKDELTEDYLSDGNRLFIQGKKENNINNENIPEDIIKDININVICNNCLNSNFLGQRYICAECENFNLCNYCQEKVRVSHNKDHTFIRLDIPIIEDIQKFNSILSPNKMLLKKAHEPFEMKIKVINNGEEDLQGCFLSPIRFGKKYLGCIKNTITEECQKGKETTLNVFMKFEDFEEDPKDLYEGYFRIFTEEGIPFGDILFIQVEIDK